MSIWIFIFLLAAPWLSHSHPSGLERAFIELNKKAEASVVNISATKNQRGNMLKSPLGFGLPINMPMTASGSGFIADEEGLIITNDHVVSSFDKIEVQFAGDDRAYPAKILGADTYSDIALLKASVNKKLVPFKFGDSEALEVGEWVAAMGNPYGYTHTMTKGIISAVKREIDDLNLFPLLQTDASVNPGNSGGPLVNLKGEVVGVNQAIARGAMGISFAIPINNVKEVFEDLKNYGSVRRAFIGVEFRPAEGPNGEAREGALITNVVSASPARKAGLKAGDRIVQFAGGKIKAVKDLPKAVRRAKVGRTVSVKIIRGGRPLSLKIRPQLLKKDSFISLYPTAPKRAKLKGQNLPGGFQALPPTDSNLKAFNLPAWARHPIVSYVKEGSPSFKAGLRPGDLLFQINSKGVILTVQDAKKTLKKGGNQLNILRYYQKYDKFLSIPARLDL